MQATALLVGFFKERMTLRRCVPSSESLMLLLARMLRAVFNLTVPFLTVLVVTP